MDRFGSRDIAGVARSIPVGWDVQMKRVSLLVLFVFLLGTLAASAIDTSALRPPKGAKVAIVVFEDLECPDCRAAEPLLEDAVNTYHIPLVRRDFPLPMHPWSFDAHVYGRFFESKSPELRDEYFRYIYANQPNITKQNLRGFTQRFADQHKIALPLFVDPTGKFTAEVKADFDLGQRCGVDHTPTIFVVSDVQRGTPFVEVADRSQLFKMIDMMIREADAQAPKAPARKPARGSSRK